MIDRLVAALAAVETVQIGEVFQLCRFLEYPDGSMFQGLKGCHGSQSRTQVQYVWTNRRYEGSLGFPLLI